MKFKGLWQLALTELRLSFREPAAIFWAIAFPTLWIGFFGAIFEKPNPYWAQFYPYPERIMELSYANFILPGGIGIVIIASAFIGMASTLSEYRELGIFKRFNVTPLRTSTLILGNILSQILFIAVGIIILFAIGKIFFDVKVLGSWPALIGVTILSIFSLLALGSAIGSLARSSRSATTIALIIFMPMIFISEMWMPIAMFPSWIQPICKALPLTPVNTILRDIVYGAQITDLWRFGVIMGWLILGLLISLKTFRWE